MKENNQSQQAARIVFHIGESNHIYQRTTQIALLVLDKMLEITGSFSSIHLGDGELHFTITDPSQTAIIFPYLEFLSSDQSG